MRVWASEDRAVQQKHAKLVPFLETLWSPNVCVSFLRDPGTWFTPTTCSVTC